MHWKTNPTKTKLGALRLLGNTKRHMEVALSILYQPNIPLVVRQISKENGGSSNSIKNLATY